MAASATEEQVEVVTLRLVIDEAKNKVVFAHAGKDFVDALLSFLTLPLGTIARLVANESNIEKCSIGSLSSLYESVANLEAKHFLTETCKEMLLQPRNSMESYCQNLKLNIDDTEKMKYFICEKRECSRTESGGLLSTYRNTRCTCGKLMNREISPEKGLIRNNNEGFCQELATFIVFDDLKVMSDNFQGSVILGIGDVNATKEVTINVTKSVIVDLLKCSLFSRTPLTDLFLRKKLLHRNSQLRTEFDFNIGEPEVNVGGQTIKVKAMVTKSNSKILYVLAEEDFVDFLFSFLTFPLGGVEQMLKGNSCLGSIDNLYKSMVDLDCYRYLKSPEVKDKLVNCLLAHQFKLKKQILPIDEVLTSDFSCYSYYLSNNYTFYLTKLRGYSGQYGSVYAPLSYLELQSSTGDTYDSCGGRGFAKSPSLYMVTDDLVVTLNSPISAISLLKESRISPSDLEERDISIDQKEALNILNASLISSSALTNALSQYIKHIKVENISH
ncbi:hypothetical protein RIF29_30376 [Crotalaria pallida]|uniref:DUF674 family protein n=1 Tax=Crotalaria pallida TaxID=3830 RepID=A0AAN9EG43_CROPI